MKVSDFSVAADKVKKQSVPQLVDSLAAGKVSVSAAARIAGLPAEQQEAVVAGIESGLKPKQALAQVQDTFANDRAACVDDDGRPLPESLRHPVTLSRHHGRRSLFMPIRRLLISMGESKKVSFAAGAAGELNAGWQPIGAEAIGDGDRRLPD